MKVLKFILIFILVVCLLAVIGGYIFLKNFDLNQYRDKISKQIGKALQTTVNIGDIGFKFGLKSGLMLDVSKVTLVDEGLLSGVDVNIEQIQLSLDVMAFLKERDIVVVDAFIREPILHIDLQKRNGKVNDTKNNFADKTKDHSGTNHGSLPNISIKSVRVVNGEVVVAPDGKTFLKEMKIHDIDIGIKDLFFGQPVKGETAAHIPEPFSFHVTFAAFGADNAMRIDGKGRIDLETRQVRLDDTSIKSDLKEISIKQLTETFSPLAALDLRELEGEFDVVISQLIVGGGGVPVFVVRGSLTQAKAASPRIPVDLHDGNVSFEYSEGNLDILESQVGVGQGTVVFKGRVEDLLKAQMYHMNADVKGVSLQDILPETHQEITFVGNLNGTLEANGAGFQLPDMIRNTKAKMDISVSDGKIKNFNLLNFIFKKISMIPGLAERFEQILPEEQRKKMLANQTLFEKIDLNAEADSGVVSYTTQLVSDTAKLDARGTLDWKDDLLFNGSISLPADLSQRLVQKVSEFSALVDKDSQMVLIPLAEYHGPFTDFRPFPDMGYLTKTLVVSKAKDEVKDLVGEALGIEQKSPETAGKQEGEQQPQKKQPQDATGELIDNIFDSIFN